jgi:hypothetical protein
VSLRFFLLSAALCAAGVPLAGCHGTPNGPGPGSTPPGQACSQGSDCYCWQCDCAGVGGAPGGGQLCIDGTCPTGEEACTPICAIVDAGLASATSVDTCPAVQ